MRYLNKIIFIQSAAIEYKEIQLDGNIHFIGTQGVGKSTILRAILFFYNASPEKLGIPIEKGSFAEYYFPKANSYLIYEVTTEIGKYHVLVFKSSNRINYRFIDSPFNPDVYLRKGLNETKPCSLQEILESLNSYQINYTKKIDKFGSFRDIVFGASRESKEYRKYAIVESEFYQNIPRTITNIFNNSYLDAEFIKQTIIDSLHEKPYEIDLGLYQRQINEFYNHFEDVKQFKKILPKAEIILDSYLEIQRYEIEKIIKAKQLGYSLASAKQKIEALSTELIELNLNEEKLRIHEDELKKVKNEKIGEINDEMSVLKDKIKKTEEKIKKYDELKINIILEKAGQEQKLKNDLGFRISEKETLTSNFKSIDEKYKTLFDQLANEEQKIENDLQTNINNLISDNNKKKDKIAEQYETARELIKTESEKRKKEIDDKLIPVYDEITQLKVREAEVLGSKPLEKDIKSLEEKVQNLEQNLIKSNAEADKNKIQIEALNKEGIAEESKLETEHKYRIEKIRSELENNQAKLTEVEATIVSFSNSFYDYLNHNYPDWEKSIGKICNKDVLFSSSLQPSIIDLKSDLFYGLKIDLTEIDSNVKSIEEYTAEKQETASKVNELSESMLSVNQEFEEQKKKIQTKYNKLIRDKKENLKKSESEIERDKARKINFDNQLKDLKNKSEKIKNELLGEVKEKLYNAQTNKVELEKAKKELLKEFEDKTELKKCEKKFALDSLSRDIEEKKGDLLDNSNKEKQKVSNRREILKSEKDAILKKEGVDIKRLSSIQQEIDKINKTLLEIEELKPTVAEFRIDKRDYIDNFDNSKAQLSLKRADLKSTGDSYDNQIRIISYDKKKVDDQITSNRSQIGKLESDTKSFEDNFKPTSLYQELCQHIEQPDFNEIELSNEQSIITLYSQINMVHVEIYNAFTEFKRKINEFKSILKSDNIFHFKTNLVEDNEYRDFSENLKSFIDEDKISDFEKEIRKDFAMLTNKIAQDVNDLTSKEGEIKTTIEKINKDFKRSNFVGVVQKIEMDIRDSSNKIVQILKEIRNFSQENSTNIGEVNLFTDFNSLDKNNQRAVELLENLLSSIKESRTEKIKLSDSFKLMFRIEENRHDTNWVDKIKNVGSNGTDILVKSMVYIMLLNVFKDGASKNSKEFQLHCIIDEVGVLHDKNIKGLIDFANNRNIMLINGSPNPNEAMAYRHIYKLKKDENSITVIEKLISVLE